MTNEWFRTDVGQHFLDCLKFSERQISFACLDDREWPWTIMGLVGMVQAGCALYLSERDTMEVATLTDSCMKETMAALQHGSVQKHPKPYMADPKELLKRVQKKSVKIILTTENKLDLIKLIGFRNEVTHFIPKSWSLQTTELPRIAKAAFVLIEGILCDDGVYQRISKPERECAKKLCKSGLEYCNIMGIVS